MSLYNSNNAHTLHNTQVEEVMTRVYEWIAGAAETEPMKQRGGRNGALAGVAGAPDEGENEPRPSKVK